MDYINVLRRDTQHLREEPSTLDPGVLDVEQWLTEEAEEQILKDVEAQRAQMGAASQGRNPLILRAARLTLRPLCAGSPRAGRQ